MGHLRLRVFGVLKMGFGLKCNKYKLNKNKKMALKKTRTINDLEIPDAYNKVMILGINKQIKETPILEKEVVVGHDKKTIFVMRFLTKVSANANSKDLFKTSHECEYNLKSKENALEQAYSHLKSLPEFEGAKDI